jgi:protein CpxP
MSDPNSGSDAPHATPPTAPKRGFSLTTRRVVLGLAFAGSFLAGGVILSGPSAIAMQAAMEHVAGHGGGMHAIMRAKLDRMLAQVDATPEQKDKIHTIWRDAMLSTGPVHSRLMGVHGELHHLLLAPTVDRAALEQLRTERLSDLDQVSKVWVQAMADSAEVLTPAQRAKLSALVAQHHHEKS